MIESTHPSADELRLYGDRKLDQSAARDLRRHLILCAACRELAPLPHVAEIRSALYAERANDERSEECASTRPVAPAFFAASWPRLSFAALLIVAALSYLVFIVPTDRPDMNDLARLSENDAIEAITPANSPLPEPTATVSRANRDSVKNPAPKLTLPARKKDAPVVVSQTRGRNDQPCRGELDSGVSLGKADGRIVIRWPRLAGAVSSQLYVSDENEVLIEEFESADVREYALKNTPVAGKVLIWKVIYTMADGTTAKGPSGRFDGNTLRVNKPNRRNAQRRNVRCSE